MVPVLWIHSCESTLTDHFSCTRSRTEESVRLCNGCRRRSGAAQHVVSQIPADGGGTKAVERWRQHTNLCTTDRICNRVQQTAPSVGCCRDTIPKLVSRESLVTKHGTRSKYNKSFINRLSVVKKLLQTEKSRCTLRHGSTKLERTLLCGSILN